MRNLAPDTCQKPYTCGNGCGIAVVSKFSTHTHTCRTRCVITAVFTTPMLFPSLCEDHPMSQSEDVEAGESGVVQEGRKTQGGVPYSMATVGMEVTVSKK